MRERWDGRGRGGWVQPQPRCNALLASRHVRFPRGRRQHRRWNVERGQPGEQADRPVKVAKLFTTVIYSGDQRSAKRRCGPAEPWPRSTPTWSFPHHRVRCTAAHLPIRRSATLGPLRRARGPTRHGTALHAPTATCTSPCLLRAVIILAVLLARCSQCSRNCTGGVFFRFFRLRFLSPPPSPPFLSMLLSRPSPLSPPLSARSAPPSPLAARPAALVRFPPQNDRIARWSWGRSLRLSVCPPVVRLRIDATRPARGGSSSNPADARPAVLSLLPYRTTVFTINKPVTKSQRKMEIICPPSQSKEDKFFESIFFAFFHQHFYKSFFQNLRCFYLR